MRIYQTPSALISAGELEAGAGRRAGAAAPLCAGSHVRNVVAADSRLGQEEASRHAATAGLWGLLSAVLLADLVEHAHRCVQGL